MSQDDYDDSIPKSAKALGYLLLVVVVGFLTVFLLRYDGEVVEGELALLDHYSQRTADGPPSVIGTVQNKGYEAYYRVKVKVIFYGSEGNTRTAETSTYKIAPGGMWEFKVSAPGTTGDYRGFDYRIVEVKGDRQP